MGTDLALRNGRIGLSAGLTVGDGVDRLNFQLGLLKQLGLLAGVEPEVREVFRNDSADLADLKGDGSDFLQIVFGDQLFHRLDDIINRA